MTWDGDVTFEEAAKSFSEIEKELMEKLLEDYPELRKGMPVEFKPSWYRRPEGAKLLLRLVEEID